MLKAHGFSQSDAYNGLEVRLRKQLGAMRVEVRFQALEPRLESAKALKLDWDRDMLEAAKELAKRRADWKKRGLTSDAILEIEYKPHGFQPADRVPVRTPFAVIVTDNEGKGLIFDCSTKNGAMRVERVTFSRKVDKLLNIETAASGPRNVYAGPELLNQGKKAMREGLEEYLDGLGVKAELIEYIEKCAERRMNTLYVEWLEKLRMIVNKKVDITNKRSY